MLQSSTPKNSTTVRSRNLVRITRAALQTAFLVSDDLGTHLAERLFTSPRRHARPAREQAVLASGRRFVVEVARRAPRWAGTTIPVTAWRWGSGPTALLVHGWEGRGSQLGALVAPLVAAGMSVVTFDAPGHGDSAGSRLFLPDHADAIAAVAAHVGPLHAIVAHSFGAPAALLAYTRDGVRASRNVMIAPNAVVADSIGRFAQAVALDPIDRDRFEAHLADATGVPLDDLALATLAAHRDDALLVIHDREDREVPYSHGERLAAAWPGATLVPVGGLGHRKILRDPDTIRAAVAFAALGVEPPTSDLVRELDRLAGI